MTPWIRHGDHLPCLCPSTELQGSRARPSGALHHHHGYRARHLPAVCARAADPAHADGAVRGAWPVPERGQPAGAAPAARRRAPPAAAALRRGTAARGEYQVLVHCTVRCIPIQCTRWHCMYVCTYLTCTGYCRHSLGQTWNAGS